MLIFSSIIGAFIVDISSLVKLLISVADAVDMIQKTKENITINIINFFNLILKSSYFVNLIKQSQFNIYNRECTVTVQSFLL